jgi:hypothetical protein
LLDSSRSEEKQRDILSFLIFEQNLNYDRVSKIIIGRPYGLGRIAKELLEKRFLKEKLEAMPETEVYESQNINKI